jgi:hypothetical protein
MIFFELSQAQELAVFILLHGLEEDDEEGPGPNHAMGCKPLLRLSRVAVEVGDDRQDDEVGCRDIHVEREQVSDANACCETIIAKTNFVNAGGVWH